jgi:hypothetical protein
VRGVVWLLMLISGGVVYVKGNIDKILSKQDAHEGCLLRSLPKILT